MAGIEVKSFDTPDELRPFEGKGHLALVTLAGRGIGKAVFEPGWRWSTHVRPIAGTPSCEFPHLLYVVSGRMRVLMDDGTVREIGTGDMAAIAPGHDAEVIGDEACVTLDFGDWDAAFAKRD